MARLRLFITDEHLRNGAPNDGARCPLALAFPLPDLEPIVSSTRLTAYGLDVRRVWPLTKTASAYVHRFDTGRRVATKTLTLQEAI